MEGRFCGDECITRRAPGQVQLQEGNEGGRFSEYSQVTPAYLRTNLKGNSYVKTSILNEKVFNPVWPDPVRPNPASTKSMLQAEYGTRAKRVETLGINLSTAYGLVLGQCTYYLRSRLEGQDKWKATSNDQNLLELLKALSSCRTNMSRAQSITM